MEPVQPGAAPKIAKHPRRILEQRLVGIGQWVYPLAVEEDSVDEVEDLCALGGALQSEFHALPMFSDVGRDTAGTMAAPINQSSHSKSRLGLPGAECASGIESLAGCRSQGAKFLRIAYREGDDVSPASIALVAR
jgi:hypothetical protein